MCTEYIVIILFLQLDQQNLYFIHVLIILDRRRRQFLPAFRKSPLNLVKELKRGRLFAWEILS